MSINCKGRLAVIANSTRLIAFGIMLTLNLPGLARADEPLVNTTEENVAIHGYDPVAYFEAGEPRRGSPDYTALWQDAEWHFASDANRRRFLSDPQRYAPRYGGFCAYAASYGQIADIDPSAWSIIDGHLYLNYSERVREIWRPRAAEFIPDADTLWPMVIEEHARSEGQ
jgi:hypothetical protein